VLRTYAEALEVLGASPDAALAAVKKIVDGLRQSWHPDHARSEADRLHRERRLRQINVAWDLIAHRRTAA
jgi:preprotein translocase subunit Sec63